MSKCEIPPGYSSALDKMQRWEAEAAKPFVGPVPSAQRLFDLVNTSANPRVRPCFFFALRNTLIADNLDIAVDWAFKHKQRFRVVTLQVSVFHLIKSMVDETVLCIEVSHV